MEGNNVKDLDQLFYLRRCYELTHLNLKYNPVADGKSIGSQKGHDATITDRKLEYYEKIRENVPLLEELDDQEITPNFFESATSEIKRQQI